MNRCCLYYGLVTLASLICWFPCQAFLVSSGVSGARNQLSGTRFVDQTIHTSLFLAKKKRRRKESPENDSDDSDKLDELPDFDLGGEETNTETIPNKVAADPDKITPAMMGNSNKPVRSINELIADRSLESNFEFEEPDGASSLPDLAKLAQGSSIPEPASPGKKKARQAERRAAAIAAKEEEEQENVLSNIPFITNEKGEVDGVKVCHMLAV